MKKLILVLLVTIIGLFWFYKTSTDSSMVTETEINTPKQAGNTDTEATIIFVGDMMFDRYIRDTQGSDYTNTLDPELISYLNTADAVIGNLEGPITNFESVTNYHENNPDHYRFTFSPDVIELLKLANFKALLLGNNHIENFGNAGVKQTTDFLELANLKHFGNPTAPSDYATLSFNDLDLALVAHNWFDSIPIEDTINLVSNLNNNHDYVIVMPHWGEEYETIANSKQTQEATLLITAGADLIIGSHPHVVQNNDQVDDTLIYYSLGNFVFDQYFSDAVRCGEIIKIKFSKNSITPIESRRIFLNGDGRTKLASTSECTI